MLSASPSSDFYTKFTLELKPNRDSIQMVVERGPPVWESSTKNFKLHVLTDSEHKFHKKGIEN